MSKGGSNGRRLPSMTKGEFVEHWLSLMTPINDKQVTRRQRSDKHWWHVMNGPNDPFCGYLWANGVMESLKCLKPIAHDDMEPLMVDKGVGDTLVMEIWVFITHLRWTQPLYHEALVAYAWWCPWKPNAFKWWSLCGSPDLAHLVRSPCLGLCLQKDLEHALKLLP